jgi:hypothetical protein
VSVISLPLPSGAATEATQLNVELGVASIESTVSVVDVGSPVTAQRVAAMLGVGSLAVSDSNAVPVKDVKNLIGVPVHDAITYTFPNANTITYQYRVGGDTGTIVGSITMVYPGPAPVPEFLSIVRT